MARTQSDIEAAIDSAMLLKEMHEENARDAGKEIERLQSELASFDSGTVLEGPRRAQLRAAASAIFNGFTWYETKEGGEYWSNLNRRLLELSDGGKLK